MGLFILFYFNFNGVESKQWEKVYEESKILLDRFPIDLMRYKHEEKFGSKRGIFTTKLIENKGKDDEFWRIDGDMLSGKRAETFMLSKKEYFVERRLKTDEKDVLWAEEDYLDCIEGNGHPLFNSKTQGYPYHFAALAVGILFENRFPMHGYVTGDIEPWQVDVVLKWMNQCKVFGQPLLKPICMDGPRLWKRLNNLYTDKIQMIKRFKSVFRGFDDEKMETLFKYGDIDMVRDDFFNELNEWNSLSQYGAMQSIARWLNSTHDFETLIRSTCFAPKKENFKLEDLLAVVCRMFINIPIEERRPLSLFRLEEKRLHTIGDMFAQAFMALGGARQDIDLYMSTSELLDTFSRFEPDEEKRKSLEKTIETSLKENKEYLEKTKEIIDQVMKTRKTKTKGPLPVIDAAETADNPEEETPEQVIVSSALSQQEKISDPVKLAKLFGDSLHRFIERNKDVLQEYLDSTDREFLLEKIITASFEEGFALVEKAWKNIDNEKRLPVLKAILCLTLIHNNEINFWRLRIYLLEHKRLWKYFALESQEKKIQPG